jgi:hypothetical protein
MNTQTLNKSTWWDSLTPTEKQNLTNNFYCKFRQVFWKEVSLNDIGIMFFRFNKTKQK